LGTTSGAGYTYPSGAPEFTPVFSETRVAFGIDLTGDKVIMDPIVSEEHSYEENELEIQGFFLHVL